MIVGAVNANLEPVVTVGVHAPSGASAVIEAILDTGFSGELSVSTDVVRRLGLNIVDFTQAIIAGGRAIRVPWCFMELRFGGMSREILALVMDGMPLLGMSALLDQAVSIQAWPGGAVRLSGKPR